MGDYGDFPKQNKQEESECGRGVNFSEKLSLRCLHLWIVHIAHTLQFFITCLYDAEHGISIKCQLDRGDWAIISFNQ